MKINNPYYIKDDDIIRHCASYKNFENNIDINNTNILFTKF